MTKMTEVDTKELISSLLPAYQLTDFLSKNNLLVDEVDSTVDETLVDGMYTRTLSIRGKDLILIGALHKQVSINIVLEGQALIWVNGDLFKVKEGDVFYTPPHSKKIGRLLTETFKFMNVFEVPNNINIDSVLEYTTYHKDEIKLIGA